MTYEEYNPNDGFIYKIVWAWPEDVINSPKKYRRTGFMFLSCCEKICGSGFVDILQSPFQISDTLNCSMEIAQVMRQFLINKFAEIYNKDAAQVTMILDKNELPKYIKVWNYSNKYKLPEDEVLQAINDETIEQLLEKHRGKN